MRTEHEIKKFLSECYRKQSSAYENRIDEVFLKYTHYIDALEWVLIDDYSMSGRGRLVRDDEERKK